MQCANSRILVRSIYSEWQSWNSEWRFRPLHGLRSRGTLVKRVFFPAQLRSICRALAVLFVCLASWWVTGQMSETDQRKLVPLDTILNTPDHTEMPWKVQFSEPRLMYQQQYLLLIRARVPAELLDVGGHHVLHFIAKVQDSAGHWLPGAQYNNFEPTANMGDTQDIECKLAIYLRPGEYTVAMIAYDSTSRRANIVRKKFSIHSPEVLPELNTNLPVVEFPKDFPDGDFDQIAKTDGELFPIGHPSTPFLVANRSNIRIDIVMNIARQEPERPEIDRAPDARDRGFGGIDPYSRRFPRFPTAPTTRLPGLAVGRVLQSASVLTRQKLQNGCIYLTAVDPIRMKVALPTQLASDLNWDKTEPDLLKFDQNMIDASVLRNHKGPGMFLHNLFEKLSSPSENCGSGPVTAHYIVVVSPTLTLPESNGDMRVSEVAAERARFYYFHPPSDNPYGDDLGKILKSADPKRLDYKSPEAFRKALSVFLSDIQAAR